MIKFFKKIRKNLLNKGKTTKYFKYAIGEIVLVTIGILIALQINNYNNLKNEESAINNYYLRILDEIELSKFNINDFNNQIDTLIIFNKKSIHILNLKNKDSLIKLKKTIGALGTSYSANFTFPIIDEFLNQGYLAKIKNDSIKYGFQGFKIFQNSVKEIDNYIDNQYYTSIEPYFYKNINYANIAYNDTDNLLIKGGPKTDYLKFYDNLELYNLLTFKVESLNAQHKRISVLFKTIEFIEKQINIELEKEK